MIALNITMFGEISNERMNITHFGEVFLECKHSPTHGKMLIAKFCWLLFMGQIYDDVMTCKTVFTIKGKVMTQRTKS